MPGEVKLVARPASPGIAIGPIFRLDKVASLAPENLGQTGELAHEAVLLAQAVDAAKSTLLALVQRAPDPTSARQQLAVLEDETLASRVLDLMAEGASAEEAWRRGLEGLQSDVSEERVIEVYHRVLRHFSGERAARIPDGS
ncbi:MAG: phosphoenolpyruvate-utilizing N-terminal domain-containing protein, partial [Pseudomonadota bacterium]